MHLQEHLGFYPFLLSSSGRQLIEGFYFLAAQQMPFNLPSFPHEWFSPVYPLLFPFFFFSIDLDDVNWWREEKPSASPHTVGEGGAEPEPPDLFTPGWNQVRQLMPSSGSAATCWRQTSPAHPPRALGGGIPARDIRGRRQRGTHCQGNQNRRALLRARERETALIGA